jgi:hypothetical protein
MSSGEGPRGLDRGIARLRWLLVSAQDDASARREVLPALSRCTVLVPTIAGGGDKLRFLPHAGGGSSLALFTGLDALEHAAKKHLWAQGTQSVSFRAMSARDALELSHMQGLRSVIVDSAAEHALELKDEDISLYLSRGTGEFSPESLRPSRGTGDHGPPKKKEEPNARGTGEFGQRGTGEINVGEVREEVTVRKARDARRDDDSGPKHVERPSRAASAGAAKPRGTQSTKPVAKRRSSSGSMRRKAALAEIDDPFMSSKPRPAPVNATEAGGQARRVPSLAAPPLSRAMPSKPFESSRPASGPVADEQAERDDVRRVLGRRRDETIPLEDISSAEAARDSAERAATMPPRSHAAPSAAPMDMFSRVDSVPVMPAVAAPTPTAAPPPAPAAPPSPDLPMVGFSNAPPAVAPAHAPLPRVVSARPAPVQQPSIVKTSPPPALIVDIAPPPIVAAPVKKVEPIEEREPRGTATMAKPPAEAAAPTSSHEVVTSAELSEAVLSAIAEELRKFPEAEWACQLDGVIKPVIGVRVDPSYLQRTKDIEASIVGAAKKAGAAIQPLIVSTPAATKDARARGRMFFPWKKKK